MIQVYIPREIIFSWVAIGRIHSLTLAYALDMVTSLKSPLEKSASDAITPLRSKPAADLPLRISCIVHTCT